MNVARLRIASLIAVSAIFGARFVSAAESFAETPEETAMCSNMIYGGKTRQFKIQTEGLANWVHMHHFCDCIRFRYRAIRRLGNSEAVKGNIRTAVGGCDYVLSNVTPGFHLLPQIHLEKGRAQRVGGDLGGAAKSFAQSISISPSFAEAYRELAEIHLARGDRAEALDIVTAGLKNTKGSNALRQKYLDLGGKKPIPEPIGSIAPDVKGDMAGRDVHVPGESKMPESGGSEPSSGEPVTAPASANENKANDVLESGCRFCPPEEIQKKWRESFGERPKQ